MTISKDKSCLQACLEPQWLQPQPGISLILDYVLCPLTVWLLSSISKFRTNNFSLFPFSLVSFLACGRQHAHFPACNSSSSGGITACMTEWVITDACEYVYWLCICMSIRSLQKHLSSWFSQTMLSKSHAPVHLASLCYGFDVCGSVFCRQQINHCFTIHHVWVLGNEGVFLSTLASEVGERAVQMCDRRPENWIKQG